MTLVHEKIPENEIYLTYLSIDKCSKHRGLYLSATLNGLATGDIVIEHYEECVKKGFG